MENLNQFIEHTKLTPTLTDRDVDTLVAEAKQYAFAGICVPPFWVKKAAREVGNADIQVVTVVGFPFGYQMTETKIREIEVALASGARELDIVMNISAFKTGMPWVKIELAKCAHLIHQHEALMKVIIETAYLNDDEVLAAAQLATDAGTDFVKTSTGYAPAGAQLAHIKLLRSHLPAVVGIKASGGIKTAQQATQFIEAGAERLGTSAGVAIMQQTTQQQQ